MKKTIKDGPNIGFIKGVLDITKVYILPDGSHNHVETATFDTESECNFEYNSVEGEEAPPWPIQTRMDAARLGKTKYYTGKLCKRNHTSQRYTSSGQCAACISARSKGFMDDRAAAANGLVPVTVMVHPDDVQLLEAYVGALKLQRGLT